MFHYSFVKATGNTVLTDLFTSLQPRHQRIGVSAISLRPNRLAVIGPEHRALLAALTVHDFDAAERSVAQPPASRRRGVSADVN